MRRRHSQRLRKLKRMQQFVPEEAGLSPIVRVWALRAMLDLRGIYRNFEGHRYSELMLSKVLRLEFGLETSADEDDDDDDKKQLVKMVASLRKEYETLDASTNPPIDDTVLMNNLALLQKAIGASDADVAVLAFLILLECEPALSEAVEMLGDMSMAQTRRSIAVILGLDEKAVKAALDKNGVLLRSGLVEINDMDSRDLSSRFSLIDSNLLEWSEDPIDDPACLIRNKVHAVAASELSLGDYTHISGELETLLPYLQKAIESNKTGVNILVYGPPGTGKTQLTRVLASELGCNLYEIASENDEGPVDAAKRLSLYGLAQSFLASGRCMLVMDEADDVLASTVNFALFDMLGGKASVSRAAVNRILEENPLITFWVANYIGHIDPAFMRRFDMVLKLPAPPQSQRQRMLERLCENLVSEDCIARLADCEHVTPAIMARSVDVVRSIREDIDAQQAAVKLESLVENTLQAQGHRVKLRKQARLPDYYDPALINTTADMMAISEGLRNNRQGRLCLYGPPGTGKTAYGHWLAQTLDMPLLLKRASDMVSPYLGDTEQNIAQAFEQAEKENSLLMIDEVDSFLQDRKGAHRSWEVSQVNEFLTQMENYEGLFIASTNLMDSLDAAALRRFDFKAKFDFLRAEQAWRLFTGLCRTLKLSVRSKTLQSRLAEIPQLTPGDFAVVARSHRFKPYSKAAEIVDALAQESALKTPCAQAIGFIKA